MRRRRTLLVVAVVLGATAIAASLAPAPNERSDPEPPPPPPAAMREADTGSRGITRVRFDAARNETRTVPAGSHVAIEVTTPEPGEVVLPTLGLDGFASPGTPAVFDVLAEEPQRILLKWAPSGAELRDAGALFVEEQAAN